MQRWNDHISILRCPVTAQGLRALSADEIFDLNELIDSGERTHSDGSAVRERLNDGAFANTGGTHFYRVEQQIAWLLPALAIVGQKYVLASASDESAIVQSFYDNYGWLPMEGGGYNDAVAFTAINKVASDYTKRCNNRVLDELSRGRYLLDAASGPVPGPSYEMLSQNYDWRVCVDFSFRALLEAKSNLGDRALYLLGDLTCLPIADGAVDDAVSLHTIYHIPDQLQDCAVDELARVVKPGGKAVIVYEWRTAPIMEAALRTSMFVGQIRARIRGTYHSDRNVSANTSQPPIYFSPKPRSWLRSIADRHKVSLRIFSVVNSPFQRAFMRDTRFGRTVANLIFPAEKALQPLTARFGQYPLLVIQK